MGGRRGTERRKLSSAVLVRLPHDVAERVEATAKTRDLSAAAWLRSLAVDAIGADSIDAVPTPPRRPPPPAAVVEIARLREVVAELTGALVQTAIRARRGRLDVLHDTVEAVLPGVKNAVRDIDRLKASLIRNGP